MFTQKFRDMSLKHKIQCITLFCVIFISVTSFISIYCIIKANEKALYRSVSSNLAYAATEISECLAQTENLANMILSDTIIQEQLPMIMDTGIRAKKQLYETNVYNTLCNYLFNSSGNYVSYIAVFQEDNAIISTYFPYIQNLSSDALNNLIDTGKSHEGGTVWVTDYSIEHGLFLVKELREAKELSFRSLGVLIINIDMDSLFSQTTAFHSDYDTLSYLLTDRDKLLYGMDNLPEINVSDLKKNLKDDYGILSLNGEPVFAVQRPLNNYCWDYICIVSYKSISHTISVTVKICILAMILSIIFTFFTSSQILKTLTRHFDRLIRKINRFGDGNYTLIEDTCDYRNRQDEIGQLHTSFDSMAQKVDTLITENYINELLKKEAQIKALESQMDPHFLYNTLDSINWRAKALKADDISLITTALGNLLRISLSRTNNPFSLGQELKIVENYMTIQKLRYSQRLEYSINITEKLYDCEIPKFTIQPLLENAIRYGLEEISETCFISVTAFSSDTDLVIYVKNNGSHFEENLLKKLESQQLRPHGFGIGILNIHRRLNITYGSDYGLHLYNTESMEDGEEYAIARITLPLLPLKKGEL